MNKLHLFLIAACSIQSVAPLRQDWSLFDSSDQLEYDLGSFELASASPDDHLFSSFGSDLAIDGQIVDWDTYDLDDVGSLSLDLGSGLETPTLGDDIQWEDSSYVAAFDIAGTGCSGTLSKRGDATVCEANVEEDPCDSDKEAECCNPAKMAQSRWPGGGILLDGCGPLITAEACLAQDGSVMCCIKQMNVLSSWRRGCTTAKVKGNKTPNAPLIPPHQELPMPPQPVPEPIPELFPAPVLNFPFTGF